MWLEAIITEEDFIKVMEQLLPVKILLSKEDEKVDPDRWLLLKPAKLVELVADEGLRVTCPAEFSWSIAGVSPTMKLDELRVMLRPQVVEKNKGGVLELEIEVEESDFHSLPELIDSTIAKAVNAALANKPLVWNFTETLTRRVDLGTTFEPVEALDIGVSWGKLRVTKEAFTLVVSFKLGFVRGD